MYLDWSRMTSSFTSGGSCCCRRANFAFTPSMTATVFSPDCRRTSRMTVGAPLRRAAERCSLVPSSA